MQKSNLTRRVHIVAINFFLFLVLISCTKTAIPPEFSGKLMVRLAYIDYIITASSGRKEMQAIEPIKAVYNQSANTAFFKRNSISDNQNRIVWLEDQQVYLFDVPSNKRQLLLSLQAGTIIFCPVISPDGRYVSIVHLQERPNAEDWPGNFVMNVVDTETGKGNTVSFQNKLKGPNVIVPGMIRWLNDSSGFTYHRTPSPSTAEFAAEVCFYDITSGLSSVITKGIGGALSPKKDKLLWLVTENRSALTVTNLDTHETHKKQVKHLIDYAWSPDGERIVLLTETRTGSTVLITDDKLRSLFTLVNRGPQLQSWDIYITPIRWIS